MRSNVTLAEEGILYHPRLNVISKKGERPSGMTSHACLDFIKGDCDCMRSNVTLAEEGILYHPRLNVISKKGERPSGMTSHACLDFIKGDCDCMRSNVTLAGEGILQCLRNNNQLTIKQRPVCPEVASHEAARNTHVICISEVTHWFL